MTFAEWQNLSPASAAREVHERVRTRLSPAQQRAAIAQLAPEPELAARFASTRTGSPLAGVPYFAKDLFDVAGVPTLAGTTFLPEVRPTRAEDGALVQEMRKAGAVLAGKTHMHEFAYGITGENPHYGDVDRPGFPGRTTGGSSSGSAAVVAAGIAPLALGSDTGGSVRVPAAFCGLYGFRLMPRDPWISDAVSLSPSYDTAGWFTTNAADMRAANAALVGLTGHQREPRGCYVEMPGLDPDVATACSAAARRFTSPAESDVRGELLRAFERCADTYNTTVALEAWEVHRGWAERYRERYSPAVWQRLIRAQGVTPTQVEAADLHTATLRMLWTKFFLTYDFLILPASPSAAFTKSEFTLENRTRVLALTAPASIGALPVLTVPVPLPSGLTTGLQIIVNTPLSPVVNWALGIEGAAACPEPKPFNAEHAEDP
jgi:aspartyl-tRNA(Asn)/glutamyl-tRNA(Gln) amidotransferase subunit A